VGGINWFFTPAVLDILNKIFASSGITGYQYAELRGFFIIISILSVILGTAFLVGGIGLLRLRPWARTLSLWTAAATIVSVLITDVIIFEFLYAENARMAAGRRVSLIYSIGRPVVDAMGLILDIAFPVALIICLNLASIKRQFRRNIDQYPVEGSQ
jgi:hypothetical protein